MSDSLKFLKERIYNEGTVGQLLKELGCSNVKLIAGRGNSDDLVTAQSPDSKNNNRNIQIYLNSNLNSYIVNRGIEGDIYAIVGYILYECRSFDELRTHLYQIRTYICNALDYTDLLNQTYSKPEPKVDWNWWLRDIQKDRKREIEITENKVLDESILNEFVPYPWGKWYEEEGIPLDVQRYFGIGFHIATESVTIPVHNKYGQLIGIKGRYVGTDEEILKHKKYSYIYSCAKTIELFNLYRAMPYIQEKQQVIVVEGAKTTMKLWGWKIRNSVSIEGDKLNPVQAKLLKELGLNIDLVFAWDKGKDKKFIEQQIKQIKNRNIYYLLDNPEGIEGKDRFKDKQSPVDNGYDVFMDLFLNDIHKFS